MARKFGKKAEVSLNPLDYTMYLIGESGIGKSTVIKNYCETLAGDDGYIFLTCGKEADQATIEGIVQEPVWDWDKFDDVTSDILEHRFDDYKDLKVVVIDTIDELMAMAEDETIRLWNRENLKTPDKQTKQFKATYGGFNGPTDKAISLVLDRLWELKRVGVSFIIIGHTKRTEYTDPVSLQTYSMLSTNMDKRYFNAIKNKADFGGVAYIDRDIDRVKTGKRNVVTKKDEVIGKVTGERRLICFRDDSYAIDSKSRFADIIDKIPMDADELHTAIEDAIKKERAKSGVSYDAAVEKQKARAVKDEDEQKARAESYVKLHQQDALDDLEANRDRWVEMIQNNYPDLSNAKKASIRAISADVGGLKLNDPDFPIDRLKEIVDIIAA